MKGTFFPLTGSTSHNRDISTSHNRDMEEAYAETEGSDEESENTLRRMSDEVIGELDALNNQAENPVGKLPEDVYGMTICSLIRDLHHALTEKEEGAIIRYSRLVIVVGTLAFCILIQIYLVWSARDFVVNSAVRNIREDYDKFESIMYACDLNNTCGYGDSSCYNLADKRCYLTVNGKHRGLDKNVFVPDNFAKMTSDEQAAACHIPLSAPLFFFIICFIWALTTFREVKASLETGRNCIWGIPTCRSMHEVVDGEPDEMADFVVLRLPWYVKAMIAITLMIRCGIAGFLTVLGCRWLLATNNFEEIVFNSVALEFILLLQEMLFFAVMSAKNRDDVSTTKFQLGSKKDNAFHLMVLSTVPTPLLAYIFVTLYTGYLPFFEVRFTGFQTVLPEYKWDVRVICGQYNEWKYCVHPPCPAKPLSAVAPLTG